jgi:ATP-dependent Clp protease, protease subunit
MRGARDIRFQMLASLGVPRSAADAICDGPDRAAGRIEFKAADANGDAELLLYEYIGYDWWTDGGMTAKRFDTELRNLGSPARLTVRINSPGGDVWDGLSIFNMLSQFQAATTVVIEGLAASIASVIAMAGDRVQASEMSQMMIHDAWTIVAGNEQDLREMADVLAKIDQQIADTYAKRSGRPAEEFRQLQNKDTYLTAEEAFGLGLVDEVISTRKAKPEQAVTSPRPAGRMANQIRILRATAAIS